MHLDIGEQTGNSALLDYHFWQQHVYYQQEQDFDASLRVNLEPFDSSLIVKFLYDNLYSNHEDAKHAEFHDATEQAGGIVISEHLQIFVVQPTLSPYRMHQPTLSPYQMHQPTLSSYQMPIHPTDLVDDCLRAMGFVQSKAEHEIWPMNRCNEKDILEIIITYVNDINCASPNTKSIMDERTTNSNFKLKSVGPISFHVGCDFWCEDDGTLCFAHRKHVDKTMNGYE